MVPKQQTSVSTEGGLSLYVLDVGQGSATLLTCGEEALLIDGGETDAAEALTESLESLSITRLSAVIASHPHSDHIGGLPAVLQQIPTDRVYEPALPDDMIPTSRVYESFLDAVDQCGASLETLQTGDRLTLGDAQLEVLSPSPDMEDTNLNNWSVVLRVTYGSTSALIMGDAETAVEKRLLETTLITPADVLVVGHHGSRGASSESFLEMVQPEFSLISCGAGNSYGHPHEEAVERLLTWGQVFRTDEDGILCVTSDGNQISTKFLKKESRTFS